MSILSKLEERARMMVRPDPRHHSAIAVRVSDRETGDSQPSGLAQQRSYILRAEIASEYWANDAQRGDARRVAEEIIARLLYADVLLPLTLLRRATLQGDSEEAYRLCNEIENTIRGATK